MWSFILSVRRRPGIVNRQRAAVDQARRDVHVCHSTGDSSRHTPVLAGSGGTSPIHRVHNVSGKNS